MRRLCLEQGCSQFAGAGASRCVSHRRQRDSVRQLKRGDRYKGDYRKRRAATIAANPQCVYRYPGCTRTENLTADHLEDGSLVTACLHCNVVRANRARGREAMQGPGGR